MQNLKEIYYASNLDPIPNPDLLFLSASGAAAGTKRKFHEEFTPVKHWQVSIYIK